MLDWYGFYACRRGFGIMMVLAGATLDEVADAMGNSPDVVFKHYFKDKKSTLAAKGTVCSSSCVVCPLQQLYPVALAPPAATATPARAAPAPQGGHFCRRHILTRQRVDFSPERP
jgi:hypothetical protein